VLARWIALVALLAACRGHFDLLGDSGADGAPNADDDGSGDAADRPNRVFVTSTAYAADFGGIAAADAICQERADSQSLGGTFIALLGDAARPELRLAGSRGWVDLEGTPIVDEPATWLDGYMFHPLVIDESGADIGYVVMWVGSIYSCSGWTTTSAALMGSVVTTIEAFGAYTVNQCSQQQHFVCVETGHVAPQTPTTVVGRIAFTTSSTWTPAGGLAGADAFCTSQATANSLPGTYLALLSTSTTAAFSRFSLTGPTWTRRDGIALTATASDLASTSTTRLDSFAHVRSDGTRYPYVNSWTGSVSASCNDWTSSSSGVMATIGSPAIADRSIWLASFPSTCDLPRALTCLQE
jgi:hypothetical protein